MQQQGQNQKKTTQQITPTKVWLSLTDKQQQKPGFAAQIPPSSGLQLGLTFFHKRPDSLLNVQAMGLQLIGPGLFRDLIGLPDTDDHTGEGFGDHEPIPPVQIPGPIGCTRNWHDRYAADAVHAR